MLQPTPYYFYVIVVDGYTICICHFNVVGECLNSYAAHEHGEEKCNV